MGGAHHVVAQLDAPGAKGACCSGCIGDPQQDSCRSSTPAPQLAQPPRCFPCPRAANPANLPNTGAGLPDLGDTHVSAKFTYKMSPIQVRQRGSARLRLLAGGACN